MDEKEKTYQELFAELKKYEKAGIHMKIDGMPASPMQIVSAHMIKEECGYMRDYVVRDDGVVKEVNFHHVK